MRSGTSICRRLGRGRCWAGRRGTGWRSPCARRSPGTATTLAPPGDRAALWLEPWGRFSTCGQTILKGVAMRVVITGISGFIGGHLARRLRRTGLDLLAVGRGSAPADLAGIPWHRCDPQRPDTYLPADHA